MSYLKHSLSIERDFIFLSPTILNNFMETMTMVVGYRKDNSTNSD